MRFLVTLLMLVCLSGCSQTSYNISHVGILSYPLRKNLNKAEVIIIPSLTQNKYEYIPLAAALAETFKWDVEIYELCGQGEKAEQSLDYSKDQSTLVEILQAGKRNYPARKTILIGESVGSSIALQIACKHPELVDGIILGALGKHPRVHSLSFICSRGVSGIFKKFSVRDYIRKYVSTDKRIGEEMATNPNNRNDLSSWDILESIKMIELNRLYMDLLPKDIPVLVINGEDDQIHYPLWPKGRELYEVLGGGHINLSTRYVKSETIDKICDWLDLQQ